MTEKRACNNLVSTNCCTPLEGMFFTDNIEKCSGCPEGCLSIETLIMIQRKVKGGVTIESEKLEETEE
jgi:hypothetical protein